MAPPELKEIGYGALANCRSLRRVELNEGLTRVGKKGQEFDFDDGWQHYPGVFQNSGIEVITLPSTLIEIGENTFRDSGVKIIYL